MRCKGTKNNTYKQIYHTKNSVVDLDGVIAGNCDW